MESVMGVKLGTEPDQFVHSRYIIAWASNIHGNNVHLWPYIVEARRRGAKLVVIDPYRTRTAACADWYLPINPGTDGALALAMMHVIIGEGLHDADYIEKYTLGFDELCKKVKAYPPERVAQWTGISAEDIRKLALEYATSRPAVIRLNYGVQRSDGGGTATRAISMLPCITGSLKEVGGGIHLSTSGAFDLNKQSLRRPDLRPDGVKSPRIVNMVELGKALNTLNDPPLKALFVYNSNPAAVCPNHNEVVRGLKRQDLFTVVHEQFFTDTTDIARLAANARVVGERVAVQAEERAASGALRLPALGFDVAHLEIDVAIFEAKKAHHAVAAQERVVAEHGRILRIRDRAIPVAVDLFGYFALSDQVVNIALDAGGCVPAREVHRVGERFCH